MSAYIVVQFTPINKELLPVYSAKAAVTIANHQGEFLAKSEVKSLVGLSDYQYNAIINFPSEELANQWFHSLEYRALIELRDKAMDATFLLVS